MSNKASGSSFYWYWGVVESRDDPENLGRLKVRWIGVHTQDRSLVATEDLPWATVIMPPFSASASGVGQSPTGLVEGSWVIGFFMDNAELQNPVILGSIYGAPDAKNNPAEGFTDPNNAFPREAMLGNDVSKLARPEAEEHPSLIAKRASKIDYVPTAKAYSINSVASVENTDHQVLKSWAEPNPRYGGETNGVYAITETSSYPLNHVYESESGHIQEFDDTPGAWRRHTYHPAGTFEEVQYDGSRILKIVSDDHEIVLKDRNIYIHGDYNLTVNGDMRTRVTGNHFLEIDKNQYTTIRGSRHTKITGNDLKEVTTDQAYQINGNCTQSVDLTWTTKTGVDSKHTVKNNYELKISNTSLTTSTSDMKIITTANLAIISSKSTNMGAGTTLSMGSNGKLTLKTLANAKLESTAAMYIHSGQTMDIESDRDINIDSAAPTYHINLNS